MPPSPVDVKPDETVQAFARWLAEMRARSAKTCRELLSEMAIIRDGITSNNVDLTEFKRHSSGIQSQMQTQLTDLREKLTHAFGEITTLVRAKSQSDNEHLEDINNLQQAIACKHAELEVLKRSYSQAHEQLSTSLIQMQNHLEVTSTEARSCSRTWEKVQGDLASRFAESDQTLRSLEDQVNVGNTQSRQQMLSLQEETKRMRESMEGIRAEFNDHKRSTNATQNMLQNQVWNLEEGRKRMQGAHQARVTGPAPGIPLAQVEAYRATSPRPQFPTVTAAAGTAPWGSTATLPAQPNISMSPQAGMVSPCSSGATAFLTGSPTAARSPSPQPLVQGYAGVGFAGAGAAQLGTLQSLRMGNSR